ncbi:hypothetical protein [Sphingomonas sp. KC8]|uniref:hypothetical protein n=1 Tax=Sphingomonas sp. KC8 TaxID=1030157 RepID=UPI000248A436|nr:hypothetical protein [Sphingomonas sp. KC8]ARS27613.1 hypothetical protein KC8_09945 [Sphingomonas sp. KC8]
MIEIIPFEPIDLTRIRVQAEQSIETMGGAALTVEHGDYLAAAGPAYTVLRHRVPVVAAGVVENDAYHATAWAVLSGDIGVGIVALTRAIGRFLACDEYVRVDTLVRTDFVRGHRWARMLGFQREGTLHRWRAGTTDFDMYARIRGEVAHG